MESKTTNKAVTYSPSNELQAAIKTYVVERLGGKTPEWALFLRWRVDGTLIYVQSSSGSNLALVDFAKGEIRYTDRIPAVAGRVDELPAEWRPEFMGFDRDGNYADEATRERMTARYAAQDNARRAGDVHALAALESGRRTEHVEQTEVDWSSTQVQSVVIPGARQGITTNVQRRYAAAVRREAKRRGLRVTVTIASSQRVAHVRVLGPIQ